MIVAIDPGNEYSAYCVIDPETYKPIRFAKLKNHDLKQALWKTDTVIEIVESYGMPVGVEVFQTCVWIGRFIEVIGEENVWTIGRKEIKLHICGTVRAKDSNIRQALMERFGDKGTKNNPGWFYGFKEDVWSAYAIGVTYIDKLKERNNDRVCETLSKH